MRRSFALFRALALGALAAITTLAARPARAKVIDRVAAVVNDEIILDSEVEQAAAPQVRPGMDIDSPSGKKVWEELRRKTLDTLIDSRLVMQQATELKLSVTPDEVDRAVEEVKHQNQLDDTTFTGALKQQGFTLEAYKKNLKRQILELKVLNTAVRSRVTVSDEEVRTAYQQNVRQLGGDTTAHLKQILIAVPEDAPADEVERRKKVAAKVVELARAGKSWVELAKAYSDDAGSKAEGGDLGWIGKGALVDALDEVVATMDPGDVRGPIRTTQGFHVLQVVERKAGSVRSFDEAKDQLRKQLYDQQVEKASQSWIKELRKKSHVDIK
jgi:parvulin-like peptidyl-prolyl isomerase